MWKKETTAISGIPRFEAFLFGDGFVSHHKTAALSQIWRGHAGSLI
jgi:hypothetical protein